MLVVGCWKTAKLWRFAFALRFDFDCRQRRSAANAAGESDSLTASRWVLGRVPYVLARSQKRQEAPTVCIRLIGFIHSTFVTYVGKSHPDFFLVRDGAGSTVQTPAPLHLNSFGLSDDSDPSKSFATTALITTLQDNLVVAAARGPQPAAAGARPTRSFLVLTSEPTNLKPARDKGQGSAALRACHCRSPGSKFCSDSATWTPLWLSWCTLHTNAGWSCF